MPRPPGAFWSSECAWGHGPARADPVAMSQRRGTQHALLRWRMFTPGVSSRPRSPDISESRAARVASILGDGHSIDQRRLSRRGCPAQAKQSLLPLSRPSQSHLSPTSHDTQHIPGWRLPPARLSPRPLACSAATDLVRLTRRRELNESAHQLRLVSTIAPRKPPNRISLCVNVSCSPNKVVSLKPDRWCPVWAKPSCGAYVSRATSRRRFSAKSETNRPAQPALWLLPTGDVRPCALSPSLVMRSCATGRLSGRSSLERHHRSRRNPLPNCRYAVKQP